MSHTPTPSVEATAWSLLLDQVTRREATARVDALGDAVAALVRSRSGPARSARVRAALNRRQEACRAENVGLLCRGEPDWPERLSAIPDPPCLLYYRGDVRLLDRTNIAIVGARRASRTGLTLAGSLAGTLAGIGVVIVSGLALGVDSAAHRGALDAGGRTLAVLGSGVNRVQPVSNSRLAGDLLAGGGLLVSEYPLGSAAAPYRFPERNRLIAGLSLGVVVVEASARSGSLITARYAAEQGREVMAVPGTPGLPNATGSNRLLKQGAALVESAEDVLAALGRDLPVAAPVEPRRNPDSGGGAQRLPADIARLLGCLDAHPQSLDSIVALTGLDVQTCAVGLTDLELRGFVQRLSDGYIRRPSGF